MSDVNSAAAATRGGLRVVFGLTLAIFALEAIGGIAANSLALLADAGHMLTDVAGVGLALLAIWIGSRPPNAARTFGYQRLEILAAVVNAVLLFGVGGFILFEAVRRLAAPPEVAPGLMIAVALVGLAGNGASLWLLRDAQTRSLNVRGAYLEVLSDFAGSAAVIVAGVAIVLTGFEVADAIASMFIGILVVPRTWRLLRDAVDVLLEATPKGLDMALVRSHILEAPGVADCHDLHVWTITSGMNVVSAHVIRRVGHAALRRARPPVRVPGRLLRHRAQHVPDRDRRSATPGGGRARVSGSHGARRWFMNGSQRA
ncbi:MAG TPA: cation diffusion facilitator family transporter [Candidatus Saccharimonadales bacterium]|nr:cation diffusion facilitator family transporter [Candidatus Saccharimonadales bacterium]